MWFVMESILSIYVDDTKVQVAVEGNMMMTMTKDEKGVKRNQPQRDLIKRQPLNVVSI